MSSSRLPQLYSRFLRLASSWPVDPLRPHLSFGTAIKTNISKALLVSQSGASSSSSHSSGTASAEQAGVITGGSTPGSIVGSDTLSPERLQSLQYKDFSEAQVQYAERAYEALEGLRTGKETAEHPISENILRPPSNPEYYSKIRRALERAAGGEQVKITLAQRIRIFFGKKAV